MEEIHLLEAVSWLVHMGCSPNCFKVFLAQKLTSLIYITHIIVEYKAHNGNTAGKFMKLWAEE